MPQVHTLTEPRRNDDFVVNVIGTAGRIINAHNYYGRQAIVVFFPLQHQETNLQQNIVIRVKSGVGKDFPEKFKKDMAEQLSIGPYFLASVKPVEEIKGGALKRY